MKSTRRLILVLGDRLSFATSAFDEFDAAKDGVWMAEVAVESTKVWSVKARIAIFISAMRHFRDELRQKNWAVDYCAMGARSCFADALRASVERLRPQALVMVRAGEWSVQHEIERVADELEVPIEVCEQLRHRLPL